MNRQGKNTLSIVIAILIIAIAIVIIKDINSNDKIINVKVVQEYDYSADSAVAIYNRMIPPIIIIEKTESLPWGDIKIVNTETNESYSFGVYEITLKDSKGLQCTFENTTTSANIIGSKYNVGDTLIDYPNKKDPEHGREGLQRL